MITENHLPVRKRTLRKVHLPFLRKRQEDEDYEVDPDTKLLSKEESVFRLGQSLVLVEENRRLRCGPEYLNSGFKISDVFVREGPLNKVVTTNLEAGSAEPYISWEYAAKRLRSYGDLDMATWADRVDNFYENFNRVVRDFDNRFQQSSMSPGDFWHQYHMQAKKACQQVERNFDNFYKVVYFLNKDIIAITEIHYSESLYKAFGFSDYESFMEHIHKNGLVGVFEGDSAIYFNCVKHLLALAGFMGNLIYQFPEEKPCLLLADGSKKRVTAHAFHIFEPVPNGFISHYYYVITKLDAGNHNGNGNGWHHMYTKCHKGIQTLTYHD